MPEKLSKIFDEKYSDEEYLDDLTVGTLAKIIGAKLPAEIDPNMKYTRILTQSEYVQTGDIVIDAGWFPEKKVVEESLKQNALLIFCSKADKKNYPQSNVVAIANPLKCVQKYERWKCSSIPAKRIAITGSVGKTTTTGLINKVTSDYWEKRI